MNTLKLYGLEIFNFKNASAYDSSKEKFLQIFKFQMSVMWEKHYFYYEFSETLRILYI